MRTQNPRYDTTSSMPTPCNMNELQQSMPRTFLKFWLKRFSNHKEIETIMVHSFVTKIQQYQNQTEYLYQLNVPEVRAA